MCNGNCECNQTILKNQQIIYDKLKEIENKQCLWTEERICWLEEQVLRNGLETKNHDIKIVRILESMGGEVTSDVAPVADEYVLEPTIQVKKGKKKSA